MSVDKFKEFQERFSDHVLTTLLDTDTIKVYGFAKPGDWNLSQTWVFMGDRLIVTGDCYDSIYSGGPFASIYQAAKCNLSYFSEKCAADRDGYSQSNFDSEVATEAIHELICINFESEEWYSQDEEVEAKLAIIESKFDEMEGVYIDDIPRSFDDEIDTINWLRENDEIVGPDWWELNLNSKNNHPYWHLAAIKVAAKQLEEAADKKEVQSIAA